MFEDARNSWTEYKLRDDGEPVSLCEVGGDWGIGERQYEVKEYCFSFSRM